jgi:hypothetical protein
MPGSKYTKAEVFLNIWQSKKCVTTELLNFFFDTTTCGGKKLWVNKYKMASTIISDSGKISVKNKAIGQ